MGRLLVLRHGQSQWNAAGLWQGWSDSPLSPLGREQAALAGRALAFMGVAATLMASSDLSRAQQTAELIAGEIGYEGELVVDEGLREQDVGEWSGLSAQEIEQRWPGRVAARSAGTDLSVPGGENGADFAHRCTGALRRLAAVGAELAVVVAHGGVVVSVERLLGLREPPWYHANLTGWWLEAAPGGGLEALAPIDLLGTLSQTVPGPA